MGQCIVRGNTIVCVRGQIPLRSCSADQMCLRPGSVACDYEVQPGQTCDAVVCKFHAYSTIQGDLCPVHRPDRVHDEREAP